MAIEFRIDTNGNCLVSPDTASTEAKYFLMTVIHFMTLAGVEVVYHNDSNIKQIRYDRNTGTVSWLQDGVQSNVVLQNQTLVSAIASVIDAVESQPTEPVAPGASAEEVQSIVSAKIESTLVDLKQFINNKCEQASAQRQLLASTLSER